MRMKATTRQGSSESIQANDLAINSGKMQKHFLDARTFKLFASFFLRCVRNILLLSDEFYLTTNPYNFRTLLSMC